MGRGVKQHQMTLQGAPQLRWVLIDALQGWRHCEGIAHMLLALVVPGAL
ncbi:Uncharacterised protein [Klebsiella pneumoniae]|nr:Uncharacterised protein [Klebsiella pneumoniae]